MDLKSTPFYLGDDDIKWVEDTLSGMSTDDKIKQLFVDMAAPVSAETIGYIVKERKIGGIRYMNKPKEAVRENILAYQNASEIPLIVAANTDNGGNGAFIGGTEIGSPTKIAATNDERYAYELGKVCSIEARSVGCNTLFNPICDIHMNFRNPIIATRTYGNDAKMVARFSKAFLKGAHENHVACFCKHFPGDGVDERDQHLANSVNSLSVEEWDKTFGHVYKELIDAGVEGVMVGHIMLPAYERMIDPSLKGRPCMPATLSEHLLKDLLREKLGFNGVTITDASHMLGLTGRMAREDLVPMSIACGCDMFLFYNEYEEDFQFVKKALEKGGLTYERLDEAVTRVLALKAHLGLHKGMEETSFDVIGKSEYRDVSDEIAKKGITLVKNNQSGVFPITKDRYKKILIVPHNSQNPFNLFTGGKSSKYYDIVKQELEKNEFEVEVYTPALEKMSRASDEEVKEIMNKLYTSKSSIASLKEKYDLVIQMANIPGNSVVQRIDFALTKGSIDIPWYVYEVPVIFVSVNCPFHLIDVPQVQTYINCYDGNENTMKALVEKLVGNDAFMGVSPVDAFCGIEDTRW